LGREGVRLQHNETISRQIEKCRQAKKKNKMQIIKIELKTDVIRAAYACSYFPA
jgi:hypothetical protein